MANARLQRGPLLLLCALVLGASALAPSAHAQNAQPTGAIAGVVVDEQQGEPLPGANVTIKGTTTGTTTDLNGRYRLKGIEPGTYDVVYSFVGFREKTVTGVEIRAGETVKYDVTLAEKTQELDEVIVQAEAARDSEAGLLKDRAKAAAVSNAISAEAMGKVGVSTAADAMKKVTGASVVDGKYVYVRGLGDRYTNAQLNGIDLPTAAADRNAVQFDLFSANLLDNITTQKTFTPDNPGNFAGGLININTESYPSDFSFKFSSSVGIETQTHFHDDFLSYPGGNWDFLAYEDGTRSIPDFVSQLDPSDLSNTLPTEVGQNLRQNGGLGEAGRRLDRASKAFNNVMAPTQRQAPINQSYSASLGNEIDVGGNPFGFLINLNYGYSSSYFEGFRGRYRNPIEGNQLDPETLFDYSKGSTEAKMGGLVSANYTLAKNNEFGANFLYSRRGESEASTRFGRWPEQFGPDTTRFFQARSLRYTERELYSTQLRGRHVLPPLSDLSVEWTAAFSDTRQDEPDDRIMGNRVRVQYGDDGAPVDTSYNADPQGFNNPSRRFRSLNEDSYSGKLDFTVPFGGLGGGKSELKFGGLYRTDSRTFDLQRFGFKPPEASGILADQVPFTGDVAEYWADENMGVLDTAATFVSGGDTVRVPDVLQTGNVVVNNTDQTDAYEGDRTVAAGYLMFDLPVTNWLRVIGGARVERTDIQVTSAGINPSNDTSASDGRIESTDILPSLNLVFELRDDMNLRAAATRTLARPTFREIAPYTETPLVLGEQVSGNPELDQTRITNLDLRWEWFPAPGDIVAVSAFAKDFDGAIEVRLLETTNGQRTWANTDARLYGAEFEVRTSLGRFTDALKYVTVGSNLSLIQSEAESPGAAGGTREMQGQSPYTFNFDVTYDNPDWGTTAGVYFNTFGERLTALGRGARPNVYEQPFDQLDASISQRFLDHWTVDFSVENILGETTREIHTLGDNEIDYNRFPEGRSISLGLSYEL